MTPVPLFLLLAARRLRACLRPAAVPEKAAAPDHLHDSESGRRLVSAGDEVSLSATV